MLNNLTATRGDVVPGTRRRRRGPRRYLGVLVAVVGVLLVLALAAGLWLVRGTDAPAPVPTEASSVVVEDAPLTAQTPAGMAAEMSRRAFPQGAPNALLVKDGASVDALAASGLQGQLSAPLLLTPGDVLAPETLAELQRLGTPEIHMLGGTAAISLEIEQQLAAAGFSLHRHAGQTGPDTAVDVATRHFQASDRAVLVSLSGAGGAPLDAFAEALPASSLAAAEDLPVLLTAPDQLSPATASYLATSSITRVEVIGDPTHISDAVLEAVRSLGVEAQRLAAGDRFANARTVAQARGFPDASAASVVVLAQGQPGSVWPTEFIGAINTGRFGGAPMVLADGSTLPEPTRAFLSGGGVASTFLLCTPGVPEETCAEARELLGGTAQP